MTFAVERSTLRPMARTKDAPPQYGRAIAARRAYLGKSGMDIEDETGGAVYQKLVSNLETGKKEPGDISLKQFRLLLKSLDWTPNDFYEATDYEVPRDVMLPVAFDYQDSLHIPVYGTVSAGIQTISIGGTVNEYVSIDPTLPGIKGRPKGRLGMLRVNGDSMISPESSKSIRHGSMVVFEWGAAPEDKDLVVAWIEEVESAVIKQYNEGPETVLSSFNPRGPVFRSGDYTFDIRGVVRLILSKPS